MPYISDGDIMSDLHKYFSRKELLHGREVANPLTPEMEENLEKLLRALNPIREAWGKPMQVPSCYRPASINSSVGGAKASAHMMCQAIDIKDKDGKFAEWCMNNLDILEANGVYLEDVRYTYVINDKGERVDGWVHLDIRGPKSGNRVFIPYAGPIKLKVV
jgi:hypothetical protein